MCKSRNVYLSSTPVIIPLRDRSRGLCTTHVDKNLALRWGGEWQGKKARDQCVTASACHWPTLSSNSPVLLMLLPRRKLIWMPGKTAEPRTHLCPLKKRKKRHQWRALLQQGGQGLREGFWWISVQGTTLSGIRWEGTEDTVECACPTMMTRWLSHHCATGLPLCLLTPQPPPCTPPQDTSEVEGSVEGRGRWEKRSTRCLAAI